jgi:hypothetical protein
MAADGFSQSLNHDCRRRAHGEDVGWPMDRDTAYRRTKVDHRGFGCTSHHVMRVRFAATAARRRCRLVPLQYPRRGMQFGNGGSSG